MPAAISGQDEMPAQVAVKIAREPVIYVLGSGPNEDVARCLAMCYLREMQWIHSAALIDAVRARAYLICASLTEVTGVLDAATAAGG